MLSLIYWCIYVCVYAHTHICVSNNLAGESELKVQQLEMVGVCWRTCARMHARTHAHTNKQQVVLKFTSSCCCHIEPSLFSFTSENILE